MSWREAKAIPGVTDRHDTWRDNRGSAGTLGRGGGDRETDGNLVETTAEESVGGTGSFGNANQRPTVNIPNTKRIKSISARGGQFKEFKEIYSSRLYKSAGRE